MSSPITDPAKPKQPSDPGVPGGGDSWYTAELTKIRREIDRLDSRIIDTVGLRVECVDWAQRLKKDGQLPARDIRREYEVIDTYTGALGNRGLRLALALLDREF